jgi:hypothetical protein
LSITYPVIFSQNFPRRRSFETLKSEFELSDCLDFVKAGVEAIIEDQVTLRFEAEELRVCTELHVITLCHKIFEPFRNMLTHSSCVT